MAKLGDQVIVLRQGVEFDSKVLLGHLMNPPPISNGPNKPSGGVWTSSYKGSSSDWLDWCSDEMPRWVGHQAVILTPNSTKILSIESDSDLQDVLDIYPDEKGAKLGRLSIDWKGIARDYDAVHVTAKMARTYHLGAWQTESTVWFKPGALRFKTLVSIESKCRLRTATRLAIARRIVAGVTKKMKGGWLYQYEIRNGSVLIKILDPNLHFFDNNALKGVFHAKEYPVNQVSKRCQKDIEDLSEIAGIQLRTFVMRAAWLSEDLRGQGVGRDLYNQVLDYVQRQKGALVPHRCAAAGITSDDAQRVWDSMRKRLLSVGEAVAPGVSVVPRAAADEVGQRIRDWIDSFGSTLTLYREVLVDDPSELNFTKVGRFWTPERSKVSSPFGRNDSSGKLAVVLQAKARRSDVDEFETVATFRRYPGEREIRLQAGAKIQVEGYWLDGAFTKLGRPATASDESDRQNRIRAAEQFPANLLPNLHTVVPASYMKQVPYWEGMKEIKIYRSAPEGVDTIRPGDWITLTRGYARTHGRGKILSMKVPVHHVYWAGTDMNEWFYTPVSASKAKLSAAVGQCYPYATNAALSMPGSTVVHGVVVDPWNGNQFDHAWVEWRDKVYDWQISIGLQGGKPRPIDWWYDNWKPSRIKRYRPEEAVRNCTRSGHHGPWDKAASNSPLRIVEQGDMGTHWEMDLKRDQFVHFTNSKRALEIMASGKLLLNPPDKISIVTGVFAVSTVWGSYTPSVQTYIERQRSGEGDTVAILFRTTTKPGVSFPEEVTWDRDVVLKGAQIIPARQAISMLQRTPLTGQVAGFGHWVTYR